MRLRFVCSVGLAVCLVLMALPAAGETRVRQSNGRFVFAPRTDNKDPVSILQIGGDSADEICHYDDGRIARTTRCFGSHLGSAWRFKGTEMKERNFPKCNGTDRLFFKSRAGQYHTVNLRSLSTHHTCKDQYHVRLWGDYSVNDVPGEWTVATTYYEERGFCSFCDRFETKGDHVVTKHWETVENRVMFQLRASTDGESRYCGRNDFRPVPGQRPGVDKRKLYNNGRISKLSIQKPSVVRPRETECAGS